MFVHKRLLARQLTEQRESLTPINISPDIRPTTEFDGYLVQEEVKNRLVAAGLGAPVGYKIGCTTPVMQDFLGIRNPCGGVIFEETVCRHSVEVPSDGFIKLGIECEIGVFIGSDICANDRSFRADKLADYVDSIMVAMEIVDDRYACFGNLGVPTLIADNFFNSGCVLGKPLTSWHGLNLSKLVGQTKINGKVMGTGTGKAVMGHPFNALAWFATNRSQRGLGIKQGDFVLLGSVVETKWLHKGDCAEVAIGGLGSVTIFVK